MAFTLAFHIVLVPLGVSWAFMALIANYRGIKHGDHDALLLAQRWSKYMAVTFAVGAVTGTVLSFEFGLLWPRFMGQWGEAFGIPFAFEGLFFFTEAIFVAIYIYGWRRLSSRGRTSGPRVPVVITGILGSVSVVAANAWMNSPSGFTLDRSGKVVEVDPMAVIFNDAMPLMAAHMVVAAYVVGGFLIASVYAVGMLRGRRDRYHRLGFMIAFTVAAIATPIQMGVGDSLARWVYDNQPVKFAAIELVPTTSSDVPETLFGHLNSDGTVSGGIPIPGLASILSDPTDGTATVVQGLDTVPADRANRRSPRSTPCTSPGTSWSAWARCCSCSRRWYWLCRIFRRRMPKSRLFLILAAGAGVAAVITMEAGWVVSEVGRQPWIVYNLMKVEDAATGNTGVWITFVLVAALYIGLGVTTILILRKMSRRFRARDGDGGVDDSDVPYGPARPGAVRHRARQGRACHEHRRRRRAVRSAITAYAVFGGADFGAGFWDLVAGGARAGRAAARELIDHAIGPVWEANHVWLIFSFVVLWTGFSEAYASITLTLFVPLTLAAFGIVLRGSGFAFRKTVFRTRDRRNFGAAFAISSVLVPYCFGAVAGAIASGRVPAGGQAGDPWSSWVNPTSVLGGVLAVVVVAYLAAVYLVVDARRVADPTMVAYFRRRATVTAVVAGAVVARRRVRAARRRPLPVRRPDVAGPAARPGQRRVRHGVARPRAPRPGSRGAGSLAIGAVAGIVLGWGVAQWPYILPESLEVADAAAPSGTLAALAVATVAALCIVLPGFILLYVLDQRGTAPRGGWRTRRGGLSLDGRRNTLAADAESDAATAAAGPGGRSPPRRAPAARRFPPAPHRRVAAATIVDGLPPGPGGAPAQPERRGPGCRRGSRRSSSPSPSCWSSCSSAR